MRGAYVLLTGVHYVSCVRYSFPLLMTAAILVPGGAARGERIGAATPLLTFSVHYRANGSVAGDGGICAAGPGGHSFRVTDPYEDDTPSWSPDGNRIAFARFWDRGNPPGRHDEVSDILIGDAQGRHLRNLSVASGVGGNANVGPVWSPDGTKLAFVGGWYGASINIVNADGSGGRELRTFGYPTTWPGPLSWSPDGQRLLFGISGEIRVIDVDGSHEQTLIPSGFGGVWSPDGQHIAYLRLEQDSTLSLVVANADGSDPKVLVDSVARSGNPAWSPDGEWIAVAGPVENRILEIHPDGTDIHVVQTGLLPVAQPAWRPAAALPRNRRPCAIVGTSRANVLRGTNRGDLILGEGGNDTIYGLGGDDTIDGGSGHDRIYGGTGRDLFGAQDGTRDLVAGGLGFDSAYFDKRDRLTSIELNEKTGGKP